MKNGIIENVHGLCEIVSIPEDANTREWCNKHLNGYERLVTGSSRFDVYINGHDPVHQSNNYFKKG